MGIAQADIAMTINFQFIVLACKQVCFLFTFSMYSNRV